MDRRSLLTLLAGVALGWTGATVVDGDDAPPADGGGDGATATPATPRPTETAVPTESPTSTSEPTVTATDRPTSTPIETPASPTSTSEPTATATTNRELQRNLDVYSRGFADDDAYRVLYSIRNENDVAVSVTFEATVSLQNGTTLRRERTETVDPGQAASDEFVFDDYDSSPTGYGFRPLRTVEA